MAGTSSTISIVLEQPAIVTLVLPAFSAGILTTVIVGEMIPAANRGGDSRVQLSNMSAALHSLIGNGLFLTNEIGRTGPTLFSRSICLGNKVFQQSTRTMDLSVARAATQTVAWSAVMIATGCGGIQSALDPAGREAEWLAEIFWIMAAGAVVIWIAGIALAVWAVRARPEAQSLKRTRMMIIGGGAVVPTVVLTFLLIYGLKPIPVLLQPAPEGSLRIHVTGEQWWWRVRYQLPNSDEVVSANEIRLPVGEPVQFRLDSPDVIHSFWIPSLAGKMDMIPGRVTHLSITPTRTGRFRGQCAEYCGASHALMAFPVVVLDRDEFYRWLGEQSRPTATPAGPIAVRGRELFIANGCGACHTIRGTPADGKIGPDLTHVGSRLSIAAGTLPNETDAIHRWVAQTNKIKPEALMPAFHVLTQDELHDLAVFLDGSK